MNLAEQMAADASAAPQQAPKMSLAEQMAADAKPAEPVAVKPMSVSPTGSTEDNFMAGMGKSVVDLGRGAKQLLDKPAQYLEKKFPGLSRWSQQLGMPSAEQSAAATNADVAESRRLDAPLMATGAGVAGNITGTLATTMLPAAGLAKAGVTTALLNPTTYGAAAVSGGLQGALQPTVDGESKARNTLLGAGAGMAGNLAVNTIGRLAQPVKNALSAAHDKAVQVLQDAGIPLDAAQQSGSAFLNKLRSSFNDNPFTAGVQRELQAKQQTGFNRAALATIGENADAATPEVMRNANDRINGVFSDVLSRNNVRVDDPAFLTKLATIQQSANDVEKKAVSNLADRITASADANGLVPGQVAYSIKKDLDRLSNTSDTTLSYWARQLNSALKDQIQSGLSKEDAQAFNTARSQFGKLKTLEPAIDRVGGGDISAAKLANTFATKQNRQLSIYGRGDTDLVDLAQAGNMLLKDKAPNSGTPSRIAMQLGIGALGGGAYDVSQGDYGDAVKHAAAGAVGMYALPKLAQAALNSPASANFLTQGMRGPMKPLRDVLLLPQKNELIGGALRRIPQAIETQSGQ